MSSVFQKIVDKKNYRKEFQNQRKTNEEYISVGYGCIRFTDSYKFFYKVV